MVLVEDPIAVAGVEADAAGDDPCAGRQAERFVRRESWPRASVSTSFAAELTSVISG